MDTAQDDVAYNSDALDRKRGWVGWGDRAERKSRTKEKARAAEREASRRLRENYNHRQLAQ